MRTRGILSVVAIAGVAGLLALYTRTGPVSGQSFLELDSVDSAFARYLAEHSKSYATKEEYEKRREVFAQNLRFVSDQNSQNGVTYRVGLNKFSDLTKEEFESMYLGDIGLPDDIKESTESLHLEQGQFTPVDWRTKNVVGAVKDQGKCGSCWSFSTVGPIEEHYAIKYGRQVVLSEQQLVDCSWDFGNMGCNGGLFAWGYGYVKEFGMMPASSYPYVANDTKCTYDEGEVTVQISGTISAVRSATGLKAALMNGPASISLYASADSFRSYTSGIYNDAACLTTVNHAVQTVGWGHDDASGLNYFIVRNSWGASWGDKGYIKIAETNTDLGICGMLFRVPMQPIIM